MDIRDYLKENVLLFDGAMGTYYASRNRGADGPCERANLENPAEVEAIHRAYRQAGCAAIKTNTFGANRLSMGADCAAVLRAGYDIACRSADGAFVFADIGPIEGEGDALAKEYRYVVDQFLQMGAEHFLFETQSQLSALLETAAHIRARNPRAFVLLSFAAQPDGFTRSGRHAAELLRAAAADANVDAVGLNCVSGARHMARLVEAIGDVGCAVSAMPNAAYPTVRGNRTFYDGDPGYFAAQLVELRDKGASILGGCCGTTPAYLAAAAKALAGRANARINHPAGGSYRASQRSGAAGNAAAERDACGDAASRGVDARAGESRFWRALCDPTQKPFAVELDPPQNADAARFMDGARQLKDGGADLITIADCPIARARMDSSLMACKLRRELGVEAMPHLTCRDRNLNATQALLLGLCAEDIPSVLIVTGDPVPSASRDEVKSVYQFNSRKLIGYVDSLNRVLLPRPFRIFGALNVNARNFDIQLELALEKERNGACGFFTQPVLTQRAMDNLALARRTLRGRLVGGMLPIVSQRNALYMSSEVPGIAVDERIVALYAGTDRETAEELAIRICCAAAKEMAPHVDGYYLITPFGRTGLMTRLMAALRGQERPDAMR